MILAAFPANTATPIHFVHSPSAGRGGQPASTRLSALLWQTDRPATAPPLVAP